MSNSSSRPHFGSNCGKLRCVTVTWSYTFEVNKGAANIWRHSIHHPTVGLSVKWTGRDLEESKRGLSWGIATARERLRAGDAAVRTLVAPVEIRTGSITNKTENIFAWSDKGVEFVFSCRTERTVVGPVHTLCNKMQFTVQQPERERETDRQTDREIERQTKVVYLLI